MKRIFDIVLSATTLVAILPLFLLILICVLIDLREYPIFVQRRIGKNEVEFKIFKFKTMVSVSKSRVANSERVTKFGRFLRSTSLDELPSLLNILKGDMSIVGPRPLLSDYLSIYKKHHRARHSVKPGLTGLAQVNGRNQITWNERLDLDICYVETQSLWLDLKIILATVGKVLSKDGVEGDFDMSIVRLDQDQTYRSNGKIEW